MIHGIQHAFLGLGGLTIVSMLVFVSLKAGDGDVVSHRKTLEHVG
jgi:hypothetical protein